MTDLRYALRALLRQPGTSLLIVATLALAIGANTAVFSIVSAVLLRPLPFASPDRIVVVQEFRPTTGPTNNTPGNFLDLRARTHTIERLAAQFNAVFDLERRTDRVRLEGSHVTADFFEVFGVAPALGRTFGRSDEGAGAAARVVLANGAWERHFSRDPGIVGRTLLLNGRAHLVDGVMPPEFTVPADADLWALAPSGLPPPPLEVNGDLASVRDLGYLDVIGRLRPGVTLDQARADADAVAQQLAREYPASNAGKAYVVRTLHDFTVGDVRWTLVVLLGLVALVLLIACANIANLLVARAADRQREVAIRAAIGAGRARVVRLFLVESLLLAGAGGALALVIAVWSFDALKALIGEALPRTDQIGLDLRVAAFTAVLSAVSAVLFGLAPLVHLGDSRLHEALRSGSGRTIGSRGVRRLRHVLVAGEMALTVIVVAAAGLMANSLWRLASVDPGVRTDGVVAQAVPVTQDRYPDLARQSDFYGRVLEELRRQPSIAAAAVGFPIPLAGNGASAAFAVEGRPAPTEADRPRAQLNVASPGFFDALGIAVLRGRDFTERDRADAPAVAIVNHAFVRRHFAGVDPLGRRLIFDGADEASHFTIVGIVADSRRDALDRPPEPGLYLPYRQFSLPFMFVLARSGDGSNATAAIRQAVETVDPRIALGDSRTLEELRYRAAATPRLRTMLLGTFAGLAVLLAWLGIYGVLSHSVAQRTRELGVRIAIGAGRRDVYALVIGEGVRLAGLGLAAGLVLALAAGRGFQGLLYEVSARDVPTFALVLATLIVLAALASYLPARRATRIDPIEALRWE
jgi:putative ABC transport system permease protein